MAKRTDIKKILIIGKTPRIGFAEEGTVIK